MLKYIQIKLSEKNIKVEAYMLYLSYVRDCTKLVKIHCMLYLSYALNLVLPINKHKWKHALRLYQKSVSTTQLLRGLHLTSKKRGLHLKSR